MFTAPAHVPVCPQEEAELLSGGLGSFAIKRTVSTPHYIRYRSFPTAFLWMYFQETLFVRYLNWGYGFYLAYCETILFLAGFGDIFKVLFVYLLTCFNKEKYIL